MEEFKMPWWLIALLVGTILLGLFKFWVVMGSDLNPVIKYLLLK